MTYENAYAALMALRDAGYDDTIIVTHGDGEHHVQQSGRNTNILSQEEIDRMINHPRP